MVVVGIAAKLRESKIWRASSVISCRSKYVGTRKISTVRLCTAGRIRLNKY